MAVQGLLYQGYLQATLTAYWNLCKALQLFPLTILINNVSYLSFCSSPICPHSHGRQGNAAYPFSSIGTHDLRDTMIRDPYRQPITDREPTLGLWKNKLESLEAMMKRIRMLAQILQQKLTVNIKMGSDFLHDEEMTQK